MRAPAVVVNAGPLMVLAKLNLLHLLKQLYGRVYFAEAVYHEVVTAGMRQGYLLRMFDRLTVAAALRSYAIEPVLWSRRARLAA